MGLERIVIENIKRIRKEKHISQEMLAELCGTSTSYIGSMETYRNVPKLSTIEKIADALNVAPQVLFFDERGTETKRQKIAPNKKMLQRIKNETMRKLEKEIDALLKTVVENAPSGKCFP